MGKIKFKFEDLKVYQKALEFVDFSYETSNNFPDTERFGLKPQFNRAAVSIALNIAEGSADTDKQFNRFLQIALGSTNECVVCVSIAKRQNFISEESENEIREKLVELSKMIIGLQKYLRNKNTNL
ncbi:MULTISPECIES: four helix bundle protein [Tenacibaculum]|uniref:four helix bundle protein n=1 Tax=Tenacibaculum TaxID=104267 RepID=UPI0021AE9631|nr:MULTISPECIES: four helix bundle protein [Tenacibaculum]MCT4697729.1 four helix bundle protein [Tenacibaculum haliotis]WBX71477.1 four helix bundle protein [Tenacibaculum retecalamus]